MKDSTAFIKRSIQCRRGGRGLHRCSCSGRGLISDGYGWASDGGSDGRISRWGVVFRHIQRKKRRRRLKQTYILEVLFPAGLLHKKRCAPEKRWRLLKRCEVEWRVPFEEKKGSQSIVARTVRIYVSRVANDNGIYSVHA